MDIYIVSKNLAGNISQEVLYKFKNKNITNKNKLIEHCFAYYMLNQILHTKYNINNYTLEFIGNKPYLANREKYISISHSHEYIAICISDCDCGIDIELNKDRNYERIAKHMNFSCKNLQEFYEQWTKYEAVYKLNKQPESFKTYNIDNYTITAVSSNINEIFNICIKNWINFSKAAEWFH